ncbi:interleukin-17C [Aulostomus maculatus]
MAMMQIFVFSSLLIGAMEACNFNRCYDEQELKEAAERKLRSHYPQPLDPPSMLAPDSPASCPLELYQQRLELSDRSLSPWRYVRVTKKDHYPSSYVEAQCLCSGCIVIKNKMPPQLSQDFNSVPITQSRIFLKRELCNDGNKYKLTPVSVDVVVGCTCARSKSRS